MKALRSLLVLAFIGLATATASAQFANSSSNSSASGSSIWTTVNTDGYNRIYASYLPSKLKADGASIKMKGSFEAGYLRGIGLTSNVPLYLEVGGALQYRSYNEDYDEESIKVNALSLNIPVSLTYRINVTDDFAVSPNFGFDFRINVMGKEKYDDGYDEYDIDLFSDADWNRFQAGWHIGVGLDYRALHFGVQYGTDFNEIAEELKIATTSVTLGFNF